MISVLHATLRETGAPHAQTIAHLWTIPNSVLCEKMISIIMGSNVSSYRISFFKGKCKTMKLQAHLCLIVLGVFVIVCHLNLITLISVYDNKMHSIIHLESTSKSIATIVAPPTS